MPSWTVHARDGWENTVFAFHAGDEIGPRMLARIAKRTGLRPEDLSRFVGSAAQRAAILAMARNNGGPFYMREMTPPESPD